MRKTKIAFTVLLLMMSVVTGLFAIQPQKISAAKPKKQAASFDLKDIDKHGNVSLSITCDEIKAAGYNYGDVLKVNILGKTLKLPLCANYTDIDTGKTGIFARAKDTYVLLSINTGSFAADYNIAEKTINDDGSFEWNYKNGITGPVQVTISLKKAAANDGYISVDTSERGINVENAELVDAA